MAKQKSSGLAVDSTGGPVIDPTKNVLDLVNAETRRQDDLRALQIESIRTEMKGEVASIRREVKNFRGYLKDLRQLETKRINAIRKVDAGAVAIANAAAENRATTLAGQVNAAKDAQAISIKSETDPIRKDIGDLRQSQWTIAGGTDQTKESRAASNSWAVWAGVGIAFFSIMISGFIGTVAIGVTIFIATRQ